MNFRAAASVRRVTVVNWLQDLFPEVAFAMRIRLPSLLRTLLTKARNVALRQARMNVVIGSLMAHHVSQVTTASQVRVIHNWAPFDDLHPVARHDNPVRRAWGFADKFVIGYSGNLGRAHEFDTIMAAAHELREHKQIAFLIIGDGPQRQHAEAAAAKLRLSNVTFKPFQPATRLSETLSAADVHIVTLRPELEGLIVPSKFYGAVAVGRPVVFLGDPDGEIAQVVHQHDCGVNIRIGDPASLAEAIRTLSSERDRYAELQKNALYVSCTLGRQRGLSQWVALLSEVQRQDA